MVKPVRTVLRWVFRLTLLACAVVVALFLGYQWMRWRGFLLFEQEANPRQWEVFGVDVSSYQGQVDWPVLAEEGVVFAFIKATEGSGLQDQRFQENWTNAQEAGIRVGAYHFFSYDSPGETQAENFIEQVPVKEDTLPPVVDIEFYGDYLNTPMESELVKPILDAYLQEIQAVYGKKPILYVTYRSYDLYVKGNYPDYPVWVSSPMVVPALIDWDFWQYSHGAKLPGYYGTQDRIDLNVFRGSMEDFLAFGA